MLSSQSGVSEAPYPGWSGTITSKRRDSRSMNGIQAETPSAPCRYNSGAPCPPRIILILQLLTVSNVSRCGILGLRCPTPGVDPPTLKPIPLIPAQAGIQGPRTGSPLSRGRADVGDSTAWIGVYDASARFFTSLR